MKTFTDTKNRTWEIAVNVTTAKRVKSITGVDLIGDTGVFENLAADPSILANVLFVLCKPQAEALGVSDEQFGEGLAGDAIEAATVALLEDIVDFFPKGRREVLKNMLTKVKAVDSKAAQLANEKILALDPDAMVVKAFGESSTS